MAVASLVPPGSEHTIKHSDSWHPRSMDVDSARDHMGPGGDLDTNGGPHPIDDRAVSAGDGADYSAVSAVAGNGVDVARPDAAQRGEKIIKVLSRSSSFVWCFRLSSPPLSLSPLSSCPPCRLALRPARLLVPTLATSC